MRKCIIILNLVSFLLYASQKAIVPPPEAQQDASILQSSDETASTGVSESYPASDAPNADPTSMMQASSPSQSSSITASSSDSAATPEASVAPEIQPEQMKGPDILELKEESKNELLPSGKPEVAALFETSKEYTTQAEQVSEQLAITLKNLHEQFNQLQQQLNAFYETTGSQEGKIAARLQPEQPAITYGTIPAVTQQSIQNATVLSNVPIQ